MPPCPAYRLRWSLNNFLLSWLEPLSSILLISVSQVAGIAIAGITGMSHGTKRFMRFLHQWHILIFKSLLKYKKVYKADRHSKWDSQGNMV
jgi:hypothetical protein